MAARGSSTARVRARVSVREASTGARVSTSTRALRRSAATAPPAGTRRRRRTSASVRTATMAPPASTSTRARRTRATTAASAGVCRKRRTAVGATAVTMATTARALIRARRHRVRTTPSAGTSATTTSSACVGPASLATTAAPTSRAASRLVNPLCYIKYEFLYSAVSSPQDRSKRFTHYFPDRPVHSDTISASPSLQPYATINAQRLLVTLSHRYARYSFLQLRELEQCRVKKLAQGFNTAAQDSNPGPLSR